MSDFCSVGYPLVEMTNWSDQELLREYVSRRSETAFAELVHRHINMVYSVALRTTEDPHEAQDIAQNVFVALAKQAGELIDHPVLVGWFHHTARNLSTMAVRSAIRRRTREQKAGTMNEMLAGETDATWDTVAPILDIALGELNVTERDAVLLRYFESKSAAEMAGVLGISSEAAQKRVNRGVDHLREVFAKRGIQVGAGALVVLMTGHAVQAAPSGLAATISTAPLMMAAAHVPATNIFGKSIFMITTQKAAVGVTLAVAIGAALYHTGQNAELKQQLRGLRQQQVSSRTLLQQAQQERDDSSNQLVSLNKQLIGLKLSQEQQELLNLRGQVGTLRQKLASTEANTNQSTGGFARMMKDPAAREYNRQLILKGIRTRYAPLFQELKLTSEQTEEFSQLFSQLYMSYGEIAAAQKGKNLTGEELDRLTAGANEEFGKKIQPILGEEGVKRMKEFTHEIPARTTVQLMNEHLGASPLTSDQSTQLLEVVKSEPYDLIHGIEGDMNPAFMGPPDQVQRYLDRLAESNQRMIEKSRAFLSEDQILALGTMLTNSVNTRLAQAAVYGAKQ
jgi:RNA polymerase sigma factor (sigma-70 family)